MPKTMQGIVASDKPDKSIVVLVASRKTHPIYRKQYRSTARFMAHDANNEAKVGDLVIIRETRPISAKKHFTLDKIVATAAIQHVEPEPEPAAETEAES